MQVWKWVYTWFWGRDRWRYFPPQQVLVDDPWVDIGGEGG